MIFTLNEALHLPSCLAALSWCDDVIVIDSLSSDETEQISRANGARFFSNQFAGFGAQRNWAVDNAKTKHPWILILDADERVSPALAEEMLGIAETDEAGAESEGEAGELHGPETHLIPLALEAISNPARPLALFGDDYPTLDGTCIRDYVHVSDLADAHVMAVELLDHADAPPALNVGTGFGYSVRSVLEAIERNTERVVPHVVGPRRAGDPAQLVADSRQLQKLTGWKAGLSNLDVIVSSAWGWHRAQAARN